MQQKLPALPRSVAWQIRVRDGQHILGGGLHIVPGGDLVTASGGHVQVALVSVLDNGSTVRVCDSGPGIDRPERALQAGFSTAGPEHLSVIRGVGAGLATAQALLIAQDGSLEIADNLGSGAAVTLTVGNRVAVSEPPMPESTRTIMALLLELDQAPLDRLAAELGSSVATCGRALTELEQLGLVSRSPDATRTLTDEGRNMITALFS